MQPAGRRTQYTASWPIPASVSPRRSPRLTKSAVQGLRSLPLTTKGGRRTAHSRSVSGDERGRGPSRSSLSSSDHGRSSQGRRSRSREPTPPQLRNFDIGDFTVVSHTTDSFTFRQPAPFLPGMGAGGQRSHQRSGPGHTV